MSIDPRNPDEDELGVSAELREAWDASAQAEPPELLDRAVLNRAHLALEPSRSKRPWSFGWLHGLTTAAVIVLGVAVLLELRQQAPVSFDDFAPAHPAGQERVENVESLENATRQSNPNRQVETELQRREAAPKASAMADRSSSDESSGAMAAEAPAAMAADAPEAMASDARGAQPPDSLAAPEAPMAISESRAMRPLAAPGKQDPDAWLTAIRQLLANGQIEEAQQQFQAFRRAYPDQALPDDLPLETLMATDRDP